MSFFKERNNILKVSNLLMFIIAMIFNGLSGSGKKEKK